MDSKNQPNEVESSIFSQVGSYAIWCANYDKKVYEKSKQEVLEDISVTQKMILDILSLLFLKKIVLKYKRETQINAN